MISMTTKRRNPLVAFVLSLLTLGLGQVYNGQLKKGISFYIIGLVLTVLILIGSAYSFTGAVVSFIISLVFYLWFLIDAPINAVKSKDYQLKPYNKWYLYILVIAIILIVNVFLLAPNLPVKSYRSAGSSMAPALRDGDRFMVNQLYYRNHQPKRGDLVLFIPPSDSKRLYIKRIVALGGDQLEIKETGIFINGAPLKRTWTTLEESAVPFTGDVPKDTVFVVGDNLNASKDSREFGPVKLQDLKGKVLYLFWSNDKKRIGQTL